MIPGDYPSLKETLCKDYNFREGNDVTTCEVVCPYCRNGESTVAPLFSSEGGHCSLCGTKLRMAALKHRQIDDLSRFWGNRYEEFDPIQMGKVVSL